MLHRVVEAAARSDHGGGADGLADDHEGEAGGHKGGARRRRDDGVGTRVQEAGEEALGAGSGVGDGVGGPVGGQEEGVDAGLGRVEGGGGPELEEVEEREGGKEEREAPERG